MKNTLFGYYKSKYAFRQYICISIRRSMLAEHGGRTVRIRALPIGIPFAHFETMAKMAPAKALSHGNIKIILGVDRLDYTKGNEYTRHRPRYY